MKDLIARASTAGFIGFVYKNVLNHILYYMGVTKFLYRAEAASLVIPVSQANTLYGIILGLSVDLILIIWTAWFMAYLFRATGNDYYLIKGALVGASTWLVIYGFFIHSGMLGLRRVSGLEAGLTSLLFDITMGVATALSLIYLERRKSIF